MQEEQNVKLVQGAYAAFGRGDMAALLAVMDDDIVWSPVHGAGSHVPTSGERRGRAATCPRTGDPLTSAFPPTPLPSAEASSSRW